MAWQLFYTKQVQKDAKKLAGSSLKKQAQHLLVFLNKTHSLRLRAMKYLLMICKERIHGELISSIALFTKCLKMKVR